MMDLLLTECHQNDRDEEIQHNKGHEHNAGANEESTKHWIVIQNLWRKKILGSTTFYKALRYLHNNPTDLFIVKNAKLQADHGLSSI